MINQNSISADRLVDYIDQYLSHGALGDEDAQRMRAYWLDRFAGGVPALDLPTDQPRRATAASSEAKESVTLDALLSARIKRSALEQASTLSAFLLTAFLTMLYRFSGQSDIVIGVPVAMRKVRSQEPLVDPLGTPLPIRVQCDGQSSFATHLRLVEATLLDAADHNSPSLGDLTKQIDVAAMFRLEKKRVEIDIAGTDAAVSPPPARRAKFELEMAVHDTEREIVVACSYDSALWGADTIRRWIGYYGTLLGAAAADPQTPLGLVALMTESERQEAVSGWNTTAALPAAACLHERFERQVALSPDAVALVFEGQQLSYAELNRRANRLAHALRNLGVTADQLVGLRVDRGPGIVIGILGILKSGGAYLPLDPAYPNERIAFMLEDSQARVVVTQSNLSADFDDVSVTRILVDDLPPGPETNSAPQSSAENLAYVIYTSGSTGKPKGALITHQNVSRLFDATHGWFGFDHGDVWTLFHSYAFDFSVWELWGALLYGGRVVVVPYVVSRSPEAFRELLVREQVTVLNQTPSAFRQLIQAEILQVKAELALRYVIFGGEALELQSLRPWFDRYGDEHPALVNMYGITETTVHVTYRPIRLSDLDSGQGSVIGVPIPDMQVYLLDSNGQLAPTGIPGELYVGGAGVSRGYLNRPELTAQRFVADPFIATNEARLYRTGDLARRLANGDLEYLGRIDHQVKIRGFRIELGEIEAAISAHPAVHEAGVLVREDLPGDKRLVAYICSKDASPDLAEQLRALLRTSLPEYMVPAHFVSLDKLPLTENGKVDRRALPAPDRAAPGRSYVAPRTRTEELLADIWAEILGLERVGIHDNFFELGGHSLLVIGVIQHMRRVGLHSNASSFFLAPTIAEFAASVAAESNDVEVPPNLIPPGCRAITPEMLPLVQLSPEEIERVAAAIPGGATNIQDVYPLAPLQEGMLFHHRMAINGDPYLVTTVFGSKSRELLDRYLRALQLVIDRHDILRTAFLWEGLSHPVQVVCRRAPLVVEELDLDPAAGDIAVQLQDRFDPRSYRLDIGQAPVIRIFIARDPEHARWVMLRIHHHLLEDHTTDELMSEEIHLCLQGRTVQLPSPLPFRNFVAQARLGTPVEEHAVFFRDMLADVDEPTAPFGFTDVLGDASAIAQSRLLVDPALAGRLRKTAHKYRVSVASLFHLAWAKVLSQCAGRDDVVFGTVLFGRMNAGHGAEQVMGPFINTLPLRLSLGDTSVQAGLIQAHDRMAQLVAHEHASLALAQSCSAVAAPAPLFNALLNFRHLKIRGPAPESSDHAMAAAVSRMGLDLLKFEERTNYPLELSVDDMGDGFMLEAQAQSPVDPRRICGYVHKALQQLVQALESSPTTPLRSLDVMPDSERRQILLEWNDTARDYGDQVRLHRLIERQAMRSPAAVALEFDGQELSFAELNRRANQLARLLRRKGVGPDVLVGVFAERSLEMVVSLLAVLKAGGAYVPLDPAYPAERLAHMLEDAQAPLVLAQAHLTKQLPASIESIHTLDASWKAYAEEAGDDLEDTGAPENLAYVIFTSGSTGRPKGAMNEHRAICNRLLWMQDQYGLTADDRVLQKTPFSFDVSVWEFFWPLLSGARLVIARPDGHRDSVYLVELIRRREITTLHFVPSMLRVLLEQEGVEACTSIKRVICSGEALPHELQERFFARLPGSQLHNLYGPTEAAVDVTYWACQRGDGRLTVPIGRPVANTQMYVLDPHMQPVPKGATGELYIGGVQVGRGYARRSDLTAERFLPDPFSCAPGARLYKTGDLARYLPDGALEYLGRTDHQVKIRGQRIELGEIEAKLDRHPGVGQSVVMAREDSPGDQRLVAYVVLQHAGVSASTLKAHLSEHLPAYMVPAGFVLLDELPLTSSGKVDRKKLPAPESAQFDESRYVAPRTPTEVALAEIWAAVLKLERVGIHDNFFELGGHSLLAVSVVDRMRRAALKTDVRSIFLTPTIAELARAVVAQSAEIEVPPNRIPPQCNAITPDMLSLLQLNAEELERITSSVPGGAANIQDIYPLATLQEGFLFHHLLTTEGDLYIMETQFAFDSRARLDRYLEAMQWVIDRHDIQRTAFLWEGLRDPVQIVCRRAPLPVEELRLDAADGDVAQQLAERFNLLNYRIDLSVPPMIRVFIAHDPRNNRWIYHQLTHHLMDDQASVNMQEEELQAYLQCQTDRLPPPRPFRNYVAQATLGVPLKEHESFFHELLGDVDEPTAPFGYTDVLGNGSKIDEARSFVSDNLARRVSESAQRIGVSTASLFHLAWAKVLSQCSGRDDVVFGTVLLGRMDGGEGAGRVLGPCINTLPMRISMGGVSVQESVRQTHHLLARLLRHEHAPLGLVQRSSAVGVNTPVFSSILNYRRPTRGVGRSRSANSANETPETPSTSIDDLTGNGWFSEDIEGREFLRFLERTNYPITLSVDDFGEGFRMVAQVQSPIDPQRICDYMHVALEQIVGALEVSPTVALSTLVALPDQERRQLLVEFNDSFASYPRETLAQELFEAQAALAPERIALRAGASEISYAELDMRANRIARELQSRGIGRGHRVGLCVERGAALLTALLGILKAGAAYVPLDPMFPQHRLRFMVEDAQVSWLVSTSALAGLIGLPRENQLLLDGEAFGIDTLTRSDLPVDLDGALPADPAYVIYTSGSTGRPKGVVVPHRAVVNLLASMAKEPGLVADDVLMAVTTLSFDIAVLELMLPLSVGATVVMASREESIEGQVLKDLLESSCATVMQATPVTWRLLLETAWVGRKGFKALVGGEALPRDLAEQLIDRGAEVWNMYGPTETTVWSTCAHITETSSGITIGRPIANTTAYIVDTRLNLCPVGVPGELCIGGDGVTLGYWKRPELTAERFIADPFAGKPGATLYRTGDRARWRTNGTLEHLGRLDHQVKLRGYRIELGEIEAVIARHPAVRDAVVMIRDDSPEGAGLVAYVVAPTHPVDLAEQLRTLLRAAVPTYMVPGRFVMLEAMPLTPNGKIDRKALPSPSGQASKVSREPFVPQSDTERVIAEIWKELLGVDVLGATDNFFDSGGHSLLAVRLMAQIERRLSRKVPLAALMAAPTVGELARFVAQPQARDSLVLIRSGGTKPPLFLVHDGVGDTLLYRTLAYRLRGDRPVYGLQPHANGGFPMLHTRIRDMAAHHVQRIRKAQANGPYYVGGLCAGGVIAFEIARQLQVQGEPVGMVALLDAADVDARSSKRRAIERRLKSFGGAFSNDAEEAHWLKLVAGGALGAARKAAGFLNYEIRNVGTLMRTLGQAWLLRQYVDRNATPPAFLQRLSVGEIIRLARMDHSHDGPFSGVVTLFRATAGTGDVADLPSTELCDDPMLGWERHVKGTVLAIDVPGGHSSMLQEPHVDSLAVRLQACIDAGSPMNRTRAA